MGRCLRLWVWLGLSLLVSVAWSCAGRPGTADGGAIAEGRTVILVSIDGFRADYLARGLTPRLSGLAREGAHAAALRPSMPTLTFPNHYTLVTGLHPDHHGVIGNTMMDSRRPGEKFSLSNREAVRDAFWWDDAEPIWVTAEKAGVRTGTMFWPGSEAAIRGVRPSRWYAYDKRMTYADRVDQVLGWLDLPAPERPGLVTLYLEAVDTEAHKHGVDSAELNSALRDADAAVGRLVDGLASRGILDATDLVIVSDHGMADVSESRVVYLEDYADPARFVVESGGVCTMIRPVAGMEAQVLAALRGAHPKMQVWAREDIPARLALGTHRRVAPIVCLADVGWSIRLRRTDEDRGPAGATHGYDADAVEMQGLFIARGPDVACGVEVGVLHAVDVQPLLAWMLGLRAPLGDGDWSRASRVLRNPRSRAEAR